MRKLASALCYIAAVVAVPAFTLAAQIRHVTEITGVNGACTFYTTPLKTVSGRCARHVIEEDFNDGMLSFNYLVRGAPKRNTAIISFMGNGLLEIDRGPNYVLLPVDHIFIDSKTVDTAIAAVGTCAFGNPYAGKVPINCQAQTGEGAFKADFETNGSKPYFFKR